MRTQLKHKAGSFGLEIFPRGEAPARHLHLDSYASVILSGSFVEAGFAGRVNVQPGDVLLHGKFDCHANTSTCSGSVTILCLPWRDDWIEGHFHIADVDLLVRLAEKDPPESMIALAAGIRPAHSASRHWTELLAADMQTTACLTLRDWARSAGMRPEALSRGFHREFGVSPKQFRLEARARSAWREVLRSPRTLTTIAYEWGFSDLAHLSRSVRWLTGHSPSAWRSWARNSVQAQVPQIT
jgi:AraC-like DNA-binding protein